MNKKIKDTIKYFLLRFAHVRNSAEFKNKIKRITGQIIYTKKYTTNDLIEYMRKCGLKRGSNIFIHSSWDEFYNYEGTADDFIKSILDVIGEEGTLAMPAIPMFLDGSTVFDVKRTPTSAGFLAERFRRYRKVTRSINIQHSVCVLGPNSNYLTNEHNLSKTCWDEKSPYFKLTKINALIFSFGLGNYFIGTIVHCVDSILRHEIPYFEQFFTKVTSYNYVDYDGSFKEHTFLTKDDGLIKKFTKRSRRRIVRKYFDKAKYSEGRMSNLTIGVYEAKYTVDRLIELAKVGKTLYIKPKYKIII